MQIITPVIIDGYVQWVHPWRVASGNPIYLYGVEFNSPYSPIQFEVDNG